MASSSANVFCTEDDVFPVECSEGPTGSREYIQGAGGNSGDIAGDKNNNITMMLTI